MTRQHEARLINQGTRAPMLEIANGRCKACRGNVIPERVQDQHRRWSLRWVCLGCGLDDEPPPAPTPLPTADDLTPARRGRPRKDNGGDAA